MLFNVFVFYDMLVCVILANNVIPVAVGEFWRFNHNHTEGACRVFGSIITIYTEHHKLQKVKVKDLYYFPTTCHIAVSLPVSPYILNCPQLPCLSLITSHVYLYPSASLCLGRVVVKFVSALWVRLWIIKDKFFSEPPNASLHWGPINKSWHHLLMSYFLF